MLRHPFCWVSAGLVLAAYLGVLGVMPKGFFWSPDEGAKYIQMLSIHWDGGLAYEIPYGGAATDPDLQLYPTRCRHEDLYPAPVYGQVRLHWPIWFSLLTRPFLSALGLVGLYVIPVLGGFSTALLAGFLVRDRGPLQVSAAILLAGLATPLFFYSLTFWEHTLATALAMAALCMASGAGERPARRWVTIGLLLFAASALRVEMMAFAGALALAALAERRVRSGWSVRELFSRVDQIRPDRKRIIWLLALVALVLIAVTASLTQRHRWLFSTLPSYLLGNLEKLPDLPGILIAVLVNSPGQQAPEVDPGWSLLALAAFAAAAVAPFVRNRKIEAALLLPGLTVAIAFSALLAIRPEPYISLHGFLPVAPYAVFALCAVAGARRNRTSSFLVATTAVLYLGLGFFVIFTFLIEPDGRYKTGLEWGTRYLLTLYPISAALTVRAVGEYADSSRPVILKRVVVGLVAAMILVALQFQVRGLQMLYGSRSLVERWEAALPRRQPVVTDIWWLPAAMAPFFTTHPMFCVRAPGKLADWFPAAVEGNVASFTFASLAQMEAADFESPGFEVHGEDPRVVSGLHLREFHFGPSATGRADAAGTVSPGEASVPGAEAGTP